MANILLGGTVQANGPFPTVDGNGQKIVNVADCTAPQDAATKAYVDGSSGTSITSLTSDVTGTGPGAAATTVVKIGGIAVGADPLVQYALLAGRAGGQTLSGGTVSGQHLTLNANTAQVSTTGGSIFVENNLVFPTSNTGGLYQIKTSTPTTLATNADGLLFLAGTGSAADATHAAGNGGRFSFTSGNGGDGDGTHVGGDGGNTIYIAGNGGANGGAGGGNGGPVIISGGGASAGTGVAGTVHLNDGNTGSYVGPVSISGPGQLTTVGGTLLVVGDASFTGEVSLAPPDGQITLPRRAGSYQFQVTAAATPGDTASGLGYNAGNGGAADATHTAKVGGALSGNGGIGGAGDATHAPANGGAGIWRTGDAGAVGGFGGGANSGDFSIRVGLPSGTGVAGAVNIGLTTGGAAAANVNLSTTGKTVTVGDLLHVVGASTFSAPTASRALTLDSSNVLTASATTDVELGYVSGVTSSIQAQLNALTGSTLQDAYDAGGASLQIINAVNGLQFDGDFYSNNGIDTSGGTPLNVGRINTTDVNIATVGAPTRIFGSLRIDGTVINGTTFSGTINADNGVDRSSGATLELGPLNATQVNLASTGVLTSVLGPVHMVNYTDYAAQTAPAVPAASTVRQYVLNNAGVLEVHALFPDGTDIIIVSH